MMEITDRHFRRFLRLLTLRTTLYTEMYVAQTLIHSPHARGFLRFSPEEHPVACQLGGSDPEALARAARLVEEMGYDEINLNCGCPSPRVAGKGSFGARLMFSPELVRDCVLAMRAAVSIPVTVKCRLGADDMDSYEAFSNFVRVVAQGGCTHFVVHARKCLLKGLDPKGNRTVPPLRYPWVQRVALENPHLRISINGGLTTWEQVEQLLCLTRPEGRLGELAAGLPPAGPPPPGDAAGALEEAQAPGEGPCGEGAGQATGAGGGGGGCSGCGGGCGAAAPPQASGGEEECSACCSEGVREAEPACGTGAREGRAGCGEEVGGGGDGEGEREGSSRPRHDAHEGALPASQFLPHGLGLPVKPAPGAYGGPAGLLESCMIGRAAYNTPWMFGDADRRFFGAANPGLSRREVLEAYVCYTEAVVQALPEEERGMQQYRPFSMAKPLIGLFQGEYGGARFRKALSIALQEKKLGLRDAVAEAVQGLAPEALDARW
jgi:tRNA-dihydrouridine synthase